MRIRSLRAEELDQVTTWAMAAPLETIPELAGDPSVARARWSNFEHAAMRAMFARNLDTPETHAFFVAEVGDDLVGHSMVFHKTDADQVPYGYFFSRYVDPAHRRRGVASALMQHALDWFGGRELVYLAAHTHASNVALQGLYARHGFHEHARTATPWPTVELRRPAP
jgi:ribosomal protein S18 acetylase RimI-like enzyme